MSFWDFTRSPASVRLLVDFGVERGLPANKLLARSHLSIEQLDNPNVELSAAQELCVVGNLLRLLRSPPGLGLEVGLRYNFSTYGVWGYGLISSATMGDAISLALRFVPLTYAFTVIGYRDEGRTGVLGFGEPDVEVDLKRFLVERDMAAAAVLLRELAGSDFSLSRFTLKSPCRRSTPGAGSVLGVQPEFDAVRNSLAFDRSYLDRRLPQANPITVGICEQLCAQLMGRRHARLGMATIVSQYLDAIPHDTPPDLAAIARLTNTSDRTLKRRLKDEGTSFRTLLAESRGAAAKELMRDDRLTLSEVAQRLGYSDLSTFSQAFKRQFGASPSTFRRKAD